MDDLRISLSDRQQAFVDEQVAGGDYASPADYVAALIDAEAKVKAQEKLEALLREGLEGEDEPWNAELMHEIREEAQRGIR